jgi:hypothetical protein
MLIRKASPIIHSPYDCRNRSASERLKVREGFLLRVGFEHHLNQNCDALVSCGVLIGTATGWKFFHAGFEGLKGLLLAQRVEVRSCFNFFRTAN